MIILVVVADMMTAAMMIRKEIKLKEMSMKKMATKKMATKKMATKSATSMKGIRLTLSPPQQRRVKTSCHGVARPLSLSSVRLSPPVIHNVVISRHVGIGIGVGVED